MKKLVLLSAILMNLCPVLGSEVSGEESDAVSGAGAPLSPPRGQIRMPDLMRHTPRSARNLAAKRLRDAAAAVTHEERDEEDEEDAPVDYALDSDDGPDSSDGETPAPLKARRKLSKEERLREKIKESMDIMLPASMGELSLELVLLCVYVAGWIL